MRIIFSILLVACAFILSGCETTGSSQGNAFFQETLAPDESIANAVQGQLLQSETFQDVSIRVLSEGGMVTLSGFVKTIRQYDTAVKIASETPGVRGVRNHLVIRK